MHLVVQRADLARALTAVQKAVEKRNTIPILSCVLLTAEDGKLAVRGTDLDIEISANVPATVSADGSAAVDAGRLGDIAKKLTGESVTLSLDDAKLIVKAGRSRFSLATLPAEDFPWINVGDLPVQMKLDLAALLKPVRFAMSTEETRYYLNGAYLHVDKGRITAAATDGHRLSLNYGDQPEQDFSGIIIPRKTVGLVPSGMIDVRFSGSKIQMEADGVTITSKLIDGTFPDYQRIIPTANTIKLKVDRAGLARAIDRVRSVADERGRVVAMSMGPSGLLLPMSGGGGQASEEVEAECDTELTVGANSAYLIDILATLTGAEVTFSFADPGSPMLINDGSETTIVLMPMRTP